MKKVLKPVNINKRPAKVRTFWGVLEAPVKVGSARIKIKPGTNVQCYQRVGDSKHLLVDAGNNLVEVDRHIVTVTLVGSVTLDPKDSIFGLVVPDKRGFYDLAYKNEA